MNKNYLPVYIEKIKNLILFELKIKQKIIWEIIKQIKILVVLLFEQTIHSIFLVKLLQETYICTSNKMDFLDLEFI